LSHTTGLLLTPTESLQESDTKKTTLATNLSKVSRKKNCCISTTYKIVKIIALHFTIIRHYIYIRGTT